jgi:hypothetical protein
MIFLAVASGVQPLALDSWITPKIKASTDSPQPISILKEKKVAKYNLFM